MHQRVAGSSVPACGLALEQGYHLGKLASHKGQERDRGTEREEREVSGRKAACKGSRFLKPQDITSKLVFKL